MSRLRSAAVIVGLFILHITVFAHIRPFGIAPDVLVLAAAVGGTVGGFRYGANHGFACGLLFDLVAPGPFGLAAGVYGASGYGAGVIAESFDPQDPRVGPIFAGLFSFLAVIGYGLGLGILGAEHFVEWRLVVVAAVVAGYNIVMSGPAQRAYRWIAAGDRSQARPEAQRSVVN